MRIWKYPLIVVDEQVIDVPAPAKALSVQVQPIDAQRYGVQIWFLVGDDAKDLVRIRVLTYGNGNPIARDNTLFEGVGEYVGTYQIEGGALVFHVFVGRS